MASGSGSSLASGKQISAEKALYSIGRRGATDTLDWRPPAYSPTVAAALKVNEHYQTDRPAHLRRGRPDRLPEPRLDVDGAGAPGRLPRGRRRRRRSVSTLFPYGIYTIPEISMVGRTEEELTDEGVPYEIGTAHYREIARGQIIGDQTGLLKLIFHMDTRELLGVHIIGEGASELVHIGQAVMAFGGKVRLLRGRRVQLPDPGRVLQDGRLQRDQPPERLTLRHLQLRDDVALALSCVALGARLLRPDVVDERQRNRRHRRLCAAARGCRLCWIDELHQIHLRRYGPGAG